jgi:hypothetical protein
VRADRPKRDTMSLEEATVSYVYKGEALVEVYGRKRTLGHTNE